MTNAVVRVYCDHHDIPIATLRRTDTTSWTLDHIAVGANRPERIVSMLRDDGQLVLACAQCRPGVRWVVAMSKAAAALDALAGQDVSVTGVALLQRVVQYEST